MGIKLTFFSLFISCDHTNILRAKTAGPNKLNFTTSSVTSPTPKKTSVQVIHSVNGQDGRDGRFSNKGSNRRRSYTMQEKYNVIESCDEIIDNDEQSDVITVSKYFAYIYTNPETVHKYVCQYGK